MRRLFISFLTFFDHLEEGCIGRPWDKMDEPSWGGKRGRNGQVFVARGDGRQGNKKEKDGQQPGGGGRRF